MSAEDKLRELLRQEAERLTPAGDGLTRIQQRVARRRAARRWLVPSAAVATAGLAASLFLFLPDNQRHTETLQPGESPSPTATATSSPAPDSYKGAAIWPFTSQAQAEAWDQGAMPWAEDSLGVTQHFVSDFLKLTGVTAKQTCVSCEVVSLQVAGQSVGDVALAHYSVGGKRVFTVVNVGGTDLTVTTPPAGQAITSPTNVSGRITGVDENVNLRLLATSGTQLAQAGAPAGSEVPWQGTLTWTASNWSTGAIVGITGSARDGATNRVVAVPVTRSTTSPTASFVGLADGHANLYDASDGTKLRQLTYPPAGKEDRYARWSAGTLVWVRSATAGCGAELNRLDGSTASTIVKSSSLNYGSAALSPSAGWVAWTEIPCTGSDPGDIVVSGGGAPPRRLAIPSGSMAELYDVTDDGALLLRTNDLEASGPGVIGVVPPGALTLGGIKALDVEPGCYQASGASFDGARVAAFETCGEDVRLVRFTMTGVRDATDPSLKAESPTAISVRDGNVLAWLFGGDHYGEIARYASGQFTITITNSGCSSISDHKGCVRDPDW